MAFNADKSLFDFSKLSITTPKELAPSDPIDILLVENNLARKELPKGPNSLMRAISDGIHHSPQLYAEIQESLVNHLKEMVSKNAFPRRLGLLFKNNVLVKDYFINPQLSGFEKVNLELVSSLFQVKVVIYTITEDNYLAATILNTNFDKTIRLLRNKNNTYNAVFPSEFLQKLNFCQNLTINIVENALSKIKISLPPTNINNSGYPVSIDTNSTDDSPAQFKRIQSRHKKSLSDPFDKKGQFLEEQELRMYNMFNNAMPPDDFFSKLRARKDTTESNFSLKANLDFIEEGPGDISPDMPKYAIKNYPIPSSGLSSGPGSMADLERPISKMSNMRIKNNAEMMFNENFSLAEVERLEKENLKAAQARNGGGFMGNMQQQQSGLFNNPAFLQKAHTMGENPLLQGGNREYMYANMNVNMRKEEQMQPNVGYVFNGLEGQRQQHQMGFPQNYQGMMNNGRMPLEQIHGGPQLRKSESMRNMIQNGGGMFMGGNGFMPQQQIQQPQGMLTAEQIAMYQGFGASQQSGKDKKKSMVAEDGSRRYTGKLKFFDEVKNYGFIIMDEDGSDIFVHFDDLSKAGIGKEMLRLMKMGKTFRLSFACMQYYGKYNKSRKAIDIELLG